MNGFADIHTHILPGVDDGAANMQQACELVRMAWQNGTRTLFLTPHYRGVYKENTPAYLGEEFTRFCEEIKGQFPDMKLCLGSEIHFEDDTPEELLQGAVLTMNQSRYVLLEFGIFALRLQIVTAVSEALRCGFLPIIAHAERYQAFHTSKTLADDVLKMGALIQMNADSVMGQHGFGVKRLCHKMLKARKVHFIATDAHDSQARPPLLRECFLRICKKYGQEYAMELFYENAQMMTRN